MLNMLKLTAVSILILLYIGTSSSRVMGPTRNKRQVQFLEEDQPSVSHHESDDDEHHHMVPKMIKTIRAPDDHRHLRTIPIRRNAAREVPAELSSDNGGDLFDDVELVPPFDSRFKEEIEDIPEHYYDSDIQTEATTDNDVYEEEPHEDDIKDTSYVYYNSVDGYPRAAHIPASHYDDTVRFKEPLSDDYTHPSKVTKDSRKRLSKPRRRRNVDDEVTLKGNITRYCNGEFRFEGQQFNSKTCVPLIYLDAPDEIFDFKTIHSYTNCKEFFEIYREMPEKSTIEKKRCSYPKDVFDPKLKKCVEVNSIPKDCYKKCPGRVEYLENCEDMNSAVRYNKAFGIY